jgi:hypothetical protein
MSRHHVLVLGLVVLLAAGWVAVVRCTAGLLPYGDLIARVNSPSGDYQLCFYRNCAGGTTGKCVVVGVAVNSKTGSARQFYFNYSDDDVVVSWTGPSTVTVNSAAVVDVATGMWDCRRPGVRPQ